MKIRSFLTLILLIICLFSYGQPGATLDKWNWLIGEWQGEGSGKPGQGSGTFSFSFDLDKKVIIRKSHSVYPATETKPLIVHEDLMIIYSDLSGIPDKSIYFDNEGHTIFYEISYSDKSIVLTSNKIQNTPVFRLIYSPVDTKTVSTRFEISQDGEKFTVYIEGNSNKIK